MKMPFSTYLDYNIFTKPLDDLPKLPKVVISTINQYSFCLAEKEPDFKNALLGSDVLLPDGVGIVAAVRLQTGQKINKISGSNLHFYLLNKLNKEGGSCFYLGSSINTLKKIKEKIAIEYPNIKVNYYSPPFKPVFSDDDSARMIAEVNKYKPDVLFIGMTAPKQEKWVFKYKKQLDTKIIGSIGAVFDFYAETMSRPSSFLINFGFEWFGRLINEPKRMWKRYLYYGPIFIYTLFKYKLRYMQSLSFINHNKKCV
ncbi:WecB/TagA/CpsF family glycosyltransferase [Mucilaginibacter arboris]|uniref:WecB/TagA/CpsF family glycosyltransferase n=1 Tax=Mucilaginibacter arboris TaxID=2682090 RepID=A0A7K1SZM6_9SPHI|nr:WecB/TagA/CpsF family glycosyltransferase [Mucilaginibacter arboris]MVN22769.1 WecB/TagA/CpsF family glycosyltransferase [Mucilaginibacter arboris]